MFCPNCANQSSDDQRFCKVCGTNLMSVNLAMQDPRGPVVEHEWKRSRRRGNNFSDAGFDALSKKDGSQNVSRPRVDHSPAHTTRLMQSGIIVGSVGIGVTTFLYILFSALAKTTTDPEDLAVFHSVWAAGLVPFFVGLGLFLSGILFRRKPEAPSSVAPQIARPGTMPTKAQLNPQREETFTPSVTEHTTRHLQEEPMPVVRSIRDTKEVN
jgi:hypothetical protein